MSVVEVLVALLLTMLLASSAVPLVSVSSSAAAMLPEVVDQMQRARAGAESLARDLTAAGNGMTVGPLAGPLTASLAPVLPRRLGLTGADAFDIARADAITLIYTLGSAQSVLTQAIAGPTDSIVVDSSVGCPAGTQVCGLQQGTTALLFDQSGAFDLVGILSLQGPTATFELHQSGAPVVAYQVGASVAEAQQHTYYFDAANLQLRHTDGAHSDVPVLDNVVGLAFEYYGAPSAGGGSLVNLPLSSFTDGPWRGAGSNRYDVDLLRVRLVRVTLRVQAGLQMLRGRSSDFVVPGLATGARVIPDYTLRFDVAPRNLNPGL